MNTPATKDAHDKYARSLASIIARLLNDKRRADAKGDDVTARELGLEIHSYESRLTRWMNAGK
jgi:hypothetical protein